MFFVCYPYCYWLEFSHSDQCPRLCKNRTQDVERCASIQKNRDFIHMRIAHRHTSGKPVCTVSLSFGRAKQQQQRNKQQQKHTKKTPPPSSITHTSTAKGIFINLERETKMVIQYIYAAHLCHGMCIKWKVRTRGTFHLQHATSVEFIL